jgi:hypothetical protein
VNWFGTIVRVAVVLGAIVTALPTLPPMLLAGPGANDQQSTILQLERDVPELMKKSNVPGVSIALIQRGKTIWVHGFGVKKAGTSQPVTGETVFEAASLSKPVFAYGVLKLVDQGKLGLDVPLTTYLPKPYIPGDQRLAKITARIVLSHRTGFPNWRDGDSLPLYFTPGERFSYSGEGYIYLQRVRAVKVLKIGFRLYSLPHWLTTPPSIWTINSSSLWPARNQSVMSLEPSGSQTMMRAAVPSKARAILRTRFRPGLSLSGMRITSRPASASVNAGNQGASAPPALVVAAKP